MKENRNEYENNKNKVDDLGQWIQEMVQDAVDSMDFSSLSKNIQEAVDSAKKGMSRQIYNQQQAAKRRYEQSGRRYASTFDSYDTSKEADRRKREEERNRKRKKPVQERQPQTGLRKIPGRWSGPITTVIGGLGLVFFGALSVGYGLMGIGLGALSGMISTTAIVLECIFLPLTIVSIVMFILGKNTGKRASRIQRYARLWGEHSFVMLDDLREWSGYSIKVIRKDLRFVLEHHLIPFARMDESGTCLILTEEAGRQYDAAMKSKRDREKQENKKNEEVKRQVTEEMTEEEKKMQELQREADSYLQEIQKRGQRIQTPEVTEKINRLQLLLSRIFVCAKKYPENLPQIDRLMAYYMPSVMKLLRVYEDMEKQPIQSANILKTRMEIAESLGKVNQALETMYNDLFQDVAMDISSDIKVLETMLAKDGWSGQSLRSSDQEKH